MPKMYRTIGALYNEVLESKVIDLIPHVVGLEPHLVEALNNSASGLYIPGSIEPLFETGCLYHLVDSKKQNIGLEPVGIKQIKADMTGRQPMPRGDLINETKKVFIKRSAYERVKRYLTSDPQVPAKGCEAAIATVVSALNGLCNYTSVPVGRYNLNELVKQESIYLVEQEEYENAFDALYLELIGFVGNDTWSHYHYHVKGTTLIIQKGLDFRIVDWHRSQIEDSETYDHDLGGVPEGYELRINRLKRR